MARDCKQDILLKLAEYQFAFLEECNLLKVDINIFFSSKYSSCLVIVQDTTSRKVPNTICKGKIIQYDSGKYFIEKIIIAIMVTMHREDKISLICIHEL